MLSALAASTETHPARHAGVPRDVPAAERAREVGRDRRSRDSAGGSRSAWARAGGRRSIATHGIPFPPTTTNASRCSRSSSRSCTDCSPRSASPSRAALSRSTTCLSPEGGAGAAPADRPRRQAVDHAERRSSRDGPTSSTPSAAHRTSSRALRPRARQARRGDGRAQQTLTTSFMTWCFVGETERDAMRVIEEARTRAMRAARFEDELEELRSHSVVGSLDRAVERLNEYAAAGVQRDHAQPRALRRPRHARSPCAERVFPQVTG